jgi:hypothetical protein
MSWKAESFRYLFSRMAEFAMHERERVVSSVNLVLSALIMIHSTSSKDTLTVLICAQWLMIQSMSDCNATHVMVSLHIPIPPFDATAKMQYSLILPHSICFVLFTFVTLKCCVI